MVFITVDSNGGNAFERVFKEIRRTASEGVGKGSISLLIVVPLEVDALCACRILSALLSADFIPFKIVPVRGMEDILRTNELYLQGTTTTSTSMTVFFINCVGSIDISTVLSLAPNITAYIVDSRRPFHLSNIFENTQVIILDDGELEENYEHLKELYQHSEILSTISHDNLEEEEEEDEEEEDEESVEGEKENVENLDDFALSPLATTSQSIGSEGRGKGTRVKNRELIIQAKLQLKSYYEEFSFGTAASNLLYALASALSKENNDYLWNAILGLTEQFVFHQISQDSYEQNVLLLKEEVTRLNASNQESTSTTNSSAYTDDYVEGRISFIPNEFRFALLRHWTLYDSMKHCEYVATKLGIWKEKGIQKLEMLLTKMAIPLKEANQAFEHLTVQYKSALSSQSSRLFPEWGMDNATFPSFLRSYSYGFQASSSDIVYSIIASLQHYQSKNSSTGWYDAFFHSFKMLQSFSSSEPVDLLIRPALHLAITNQKALIRMGSTILNRKIIKQFKQFRLVVIKDPVPISFEYYSMFSLGLFLTKSLEVFGKRVMPIVLASSHTFPLHHFKVICVSCWSNTELQEDGGLLVSGISLITNFKQVALELALEVVMEGSQFCQVVVPADRLYDFVSKLEV